MKKRVSLLLALLLMLSFFSGMANAATFDVAGKAMELDTISSMGVTKVNVESLKQLGMKVATEGEKVKVSNDEVTFEFEKNSNEVEVNDVEFETVGKTEVKDGKVYVPFRFFFETMNYEVAWADGKTSLKKKEAPKYPVVYENEGKKYTVEKEPKTIVSMAPDTTETLFRLGAGSKLVGRTTYCNYPEEALKVQEIGTLREPKIEVIVSLKPELVMAATHFKEEHLKLIAGAKINTFAKPTPDSMEKAYEDLLVMGAIVNRNYEARALASTMREKMNYVSMLTKKAEKPSVYVMVGTGQYGEYVHGKDSFVHSIILAAGGVNAAEDAEGWKYTLEKLIQKNPNYIFASEMDKKTVESGENYKALSALKDGKLIEINTDIFSRPSERAVTEGLKVLLKALHPELAKKLTF